MILWAFSKVEASMWTFLMNKIISGLVKMSFDTKWHLLENVSSDPSLENLSFESTHVRFL